MDLGQKQGDPGCFAVTELHQSFEYFRVVQKGVFFFTFTAQTDACRFVNVVILTQAIGIQDFVHGTATLATEVFFIKRNGSVRQRLTTMVTLGVIVYTYFSGT
jgi:hypothetical protein